MRFTMGFIAAIFLWMGGAQAQDELVLISPHWEGIRVEFGDAFQAQYQQETGRSVKLKWLDVGGASDILKFIRSEFRNKPDGIGVDLFFGGGTDPYTELKNLGLLEVYRLPDAILQKIPPSIGGVPLYDRDHTWYAVMMAGFGIVYNKIVLKRLGFPEPSSWEDLTRPELISWVGSADPRKSGSVHMMYEIILQAYGWERGWQIITALGANVRGFSSGANQTPKDVAIGEVAYGLAIDSYAWAQVREAGEDKIGYVMPEDLTVINGDAIAILKGAPHRQIAEHFIRFALSEPGQKLLLVRQGEPDGPQEFELSKFSVLPELYDKTKDRTSVRLNPFDWHSDFVYDAAKGSARWGIVNDLIGTFIIDPHRKLVATWKARLRENGSEEAVHHIVAVGVTEAGVQQWAEAGDWKNAEFRNRTMNQWANLAQQVYQSDASDRQRFVRSLPMLVALVLTASMSVYLYRRSRI